MSEKIAFDPESKSIVIACKIIEGIVDQKDCLEKDPIDVLEEIAAHIDEYCRFNRTTRYPTKYSAVRYDRN